MDPCDKILIGKSRAILRLKELIRQVATSDLNVVVQGESGVGKELVARALHACSNRRDKPFVKVNCAAIPSELLESELFGYERGAFTGAHKTKRGILELADGGAVLLDEIGDMPPQMQAKLLQVVQDSQFSRLGARTDVSVNCWILAATNHDLERDVKERIFREDLYYRLNTVNVRIPPLRERPEDIDILIDHFTGLLGRKNKGAPLRVGQDVREFFTRYSWPGNVRELKNTLEHLMLLRDWEALRERLVRREGGESLTQAPGSPVEDRPVNDLDLRELEGGGFESLIAIRRSAVKRTEADLIRRVLEERGWNRKRAAGVLGLSYKALLYKMKEHGIGREG